MFHLIGLFFLLWLGWLLIVGLWHVFLFLLAVLGIGVLLLVDAEPKTIQVVVAVVIFLSISIWIEEGRNTAVAKKKLEGKQDGEDR